MTTIFEKLFHKKKSSGPKQPKPNAKAYSTNTKAKGFTVESNSTRPPRFSFLDKSIDQDTLSSLQWYEILEVNPRTTTIEEVRRAFRKKIGQCHPDKLSHVEAHERHRLEGLSALINDAYTKAKKILA